jgi:hypothetical protein
VTSRARFAVALLAALLVTTAALPQLAPATAAPQAADALFEGFVNPPNSARPRVWWHWLNGNITQDGIAKDLDWMKRIGIGGVQNFDASLGAPQIVAERLAFMTPGWKRAFSFALTRAHALDLEFAIAASPGWSETGGPWVKPGDAMKKLVWSETEIEGGQRTPIRLAAPPSATGAFQDAGITDSHAALGEISAHAPDHYGEVRVLAYPLAAGGARVLPVAETAAGTVDAGRLTDGRFETAVDVPRGKPEAPGQLLVRYAKPQRIRSATFFIPNAVPPFGDPEFQPVLEAEVAGAWGKVAIFPLTSVPTTVAFAPVEASAFRVTLAPNTAAKQVGLARPAPGAVMIDIFAKGPPSPTVKVGEFSLSSQPRIDRFEAKAGFSTVADYYALGEAPDAAGIDPASVIDLSGKLRPDGTLDWTPPRGRWRIVRFGYSLTGKTNHPATPEATGLEVDKYDGEAVRRYLDTYLGMYRDAAAGAPGLRALLTDSIEVGDANWTPKLIDAFRRLRGYDPVPWLPALAGTVVGSTAKSDAFLYDYRRTLADLLASEHYGTIARIAKEQGLTLYGEALENGRPLLGDDMAMRAHADVPMAAMWTFTRGEAPRPTLIGDIRGAASVAHIYGQNVVAAESMTSAFSPWAFAPADLRRVIDLEFAHGVNRPVIHTSVHQPADDKAPGLSLAIFGQYFNRHETWAEMARPWIDYISRSSFLLQQGRNVADIGYFYGEEAPITALNAQAPLDDVPAGYGWDYVSPGALADQLSVENGEIVAKGGARYRFLYLGGTSRRMTLPVLRRIAALADAGAKIVGQAPERSPSLADDKAEFDALVDRLWSGGRVIAAKSVAEGIAQTGLAPDFDVAGAEDLLFVHRRLDDGEIYFVSNRADREARVEASFRLTGKAPELWFADSGKRVPLSYRIEGGRTIVPLDIAAEESVFVVFRKPAVAASAEIAATRYEPLATLSARWNVGFQPGRGAPASTGMATLTPLETSADPGIRYFSGIATYSSSFTLPRGVKPGTPLALDLGRVGDVAEVRINGQLVGTAWHAPYRLDIGHATRNGTNTIEVRVANLWVNRLIGDAQPDARKIAFVAAPTYRPDAPLRPSGLIGPVILLGVR